jgi:hypothetical protein
MSTISAAEYRAFSRSDLYTFMHRAFRQLNPQVPFLHNWHNELIAGKLESCFRREINRLIHQRAPEILKISLGCGCFPGLRPGSQP